MDLPTIQGLDTNTALSQEQIKRLQEQAMALMARPYQGEGGKSYTSITQPIADVLSAISGRNLLNQTNQQQSQLMQQAAGATAGALPAQTKNQQANNQPQTSIEGYNGPVPPLHQVPNKEAIANYALQLSPDARERYLEKVQELAKPVEMEVDNGTLVGNPVTQKWTFQPKTEKVEQQGAALARRGNEAYTVIAPGKNPASKEQTPVKVNSEAEFKKLKSGTPVIFPNGTRGVAP